MYHVDKVILVCIRLIISVPDEGFFPQIRSVIFKFDIFICWKKWFDVLVFKKLIINFNWCSLSPLFKLLDLYWWKWTGDHVVLAISVKLKIKKMFLNFVLAFWSFVWIVFFLNSRNCRYYEKNVVCLDLNCSQWCWGQMWLFVLLILMVLLTIMH